MSKKQNLNRNLIVILSLIFLAFLLVRNGRHATDSELGNGITYYVSNSVGNDNNDGRSPSTPFKSIIKVNSLSLNPGDNVLFKRGDTWRLPEDAYLKIKSGSESGYVTYGAYGIGQKPVLLGSILANNLTLWKNTGGSLWVYPSGNETILSENMFPNPSFDTDTSTWNFYRESTAVATGVRTVVGGEYNTSPAGYKITVNNSGPLGSSIQFYITNLNLAAGKTYKLTFQAKADKSFRLFNIALMKSGAPYSGYATPNPTISPIINTAWTQYNYYYTSSVTASDGRITFYFGNTTPVDTTIYLDSLSLTQTTPQTVIPGEVGNLIFNNEQSFGFYHWNLSHMDKQGDFTYDPMLKKVVMYSAYNPAAYYQNIEMSTGPTTYSGGGESININGANYVVIQDLNIKYGCRCGINGANINHIIIRDNDMSYIGGCYMMYAGAPVRYGNAIQFWCASSNIQVTRNYISETWDAAMTPQCSTDSGPTTMRNHEYSYNIIPHATYGFEYFSEAVGSETVNISVIHNTFIESGKGWGDKDQQPRDNNGRDFRLARTSANTHNFNISNNIMSGTKWKTVELGSAPGWAGDLPYMDYNLYYGGILQFITWRGVYYNNLTAFQAATGMETHGVYANPMLDSNYVPLNTSPVCLVDGYIGANPCGIAIIENETVVNETTTNNTIINNNSTTGDNISNNETIVIPPKQPVDVPLVVLVVGIIGLVLYFITKGKKRR